MVLVDRIKVILMCLAVLGIVAMFFTMLWMKGKLDRQEQMLHSLPTSQSIDSLKQVVIKPGLVESIFVNKTTVHYIPTESPITITASDTAYKRLLLEVADLQRMLQESNADTAAIRKRLEAIQLGIARLQAHPPISVAFRKSGWCFRPGIGALVAGGNRDLDIAAVPALRLKFAYASYYTLGLATTTRSGGVATGMHLSRFAPRWIPNTEIVGYFGRRYTRLIGYESGAGLLVDF